MQKREGTGKRMKSREEKNKGEEDNRVEKGKGGEDRKRVITKEK